MVKLLNQSRIGCVAKNIKFTSVTEASKRLKGHYNKLEKQNKLKATAFYPIGGLRNDLVDVKQEFPDSLLLAVYDTSTQSKENPMEYPENEEKHKKEKGISEFHPDDVTQLIKPTYTLRLQWEDIPEGGWVVDATTRLAKPFLHLNCQIVIQTCYGGMRNNTDSSATGMDFEADLLGYSSTVALTPRSTASGVAEFGSHAAAYPSTRPGVINTHISTQIC
ncbi:hypothetical protein JG687_00017119 [Phytophthora cactorum]|uniref:Uncharacterized protein n=1 Tax=Phytophthora cactorum TaxID=29920 RepID=A0A8T1TSS8_9STRA|nr:hypothetical protein JG687_00017119 [Phytophthora cactorum]